MSFHVSCSNQSFSNENLFESPIISNVFSLIIIGLLYFLVSVWSLEAILTLSQITVASILFLVQIVPIMTSQVFIQIQILILLQMAETWNFLMNSWISNPHMSASSVFSCSNIIIIQSQRNLSMYHHLLYTRSQIQSKYIFRRRSERSGVNFSLILVNHMISRNIMVTTFEIQFHNAIFSYHLNHIFLYMSWGMNLSKTHLRSL